MILTIRRSRAQPRKSIRFALNLWKESASLDQSATTYIPKLVSPTYQVTKRSFAETLRKVLVFTEMLVSLVTIPNFGRNPNGRSSKELCKRETTLLLRVRATNQSFQDQWSPKDRYSALQVHQSNPRMSTQNMSV